MTNQWLYCRAARQRYYPLSLFTPPITALLPLDLVHAGYFLLFHVCCVLGLLHMSYYITSGQCAINVLFLNAL